MSTQTTSKPDILAKIEVHKRQEILLAKKKTPVETMRKLTLQAPAPVLHNKAIESFSKTIFSFPRRSGLSPDWLADGMAGTACPSKQDGEQLALLSKLFDSGELKAFVKAELPMEEADHAYSGSIAGNPGRLIIRTK